MRIIAGEARGRPIAAPRGMHTRPTQDRVRESLFNILMRHTPLARVLDLFAGSGALGLEALSRGAAFAVFVDNCREAQETVQRNIDSLGFAGRAQLLRCDWRAALAKLAAQGEAFDLIFLDPPYQMPDAPAMLLALRDSGLLSESALVVYEHAVNLPPDDSGWAITDSRRYGDSSITFLQKEP